ncbi:hypothetical protein V2G26_011603 [Clonostachys chloroleuca]
MMPRPSKKQQAENRAPVPVPAQPQQHMIPQVPQPQGIPLQMQQPLPHQGQLAVGAPPPQVHGRVVDNESFLRVRDSAVGRLTTILELLRSFTSDYIRQTNLLLGDPTAEGAQGDILATFENATSQLIPLVQGELGAPIEEKKERKKRTHDPNAPKRPLTPYFLYMQHARSIIANDLGPEAPKGAVQEEGQRRWAQMGPQEKQGWNNAYQYNLRLYNARVHSYKHGNPLAKGMDDTEALKYADENQIPLPELKEAQAQPDAGPNDQDAIAEQLQQVAAAPAVEEELDSKTPKKGGARKRKTGEPILAPDATPIATPASPDKKRRRTSGKVAEIQEEPKKSGRKKTKSS